MGKLKKVYCLMGYTAVGKSTIAKKITQEIEDLHLAVSHTTRPIRPNEKEGIDYYFIDDKKFEKMNKNDCFIETRSYNTKIEVNGKTKDATWNYGYSKEEFENHKHCIAIVDVTGYEELKEYFEPKGVMVIPIYIRVKENILKERVLKRGDLLAEFERRLEDDKKRFRKFRVNVLSKNIDNDTDDVQRAVDELKVFISGDL